MLKWTLLGIGIIINLVTNKLQYKLLGLGIVYGVTYISWGKKKTFRKLKYREMYK